MSSPPSCAVSSHHHYSNLRSSSSPGPPTTSTSMQHHPISTHPPLQWSQTYPKFAHPYSIPSSECADCVTECTEPMCSTSNQLTAQCTDQCVVITCNDPEHDNLSCFNGHTGCELVCDNPDCNGFDSSLQCCNLAHPCHSLQTEGTNSSQQSYTQQQNQDPAIPCGCNQAERSTRIHPPANANVFAPIISPHVLPSAASGNNNRYSPSIATYQSSSSIHTFAPVPLPFPPVVQTQDHVPQSLRYDASQGQQQDNPPSSLSSSSSQHVLTCMWGNCQAKFTSLAELVGHVNLAHLRTPTTPDAPTNTTTFETQVQAQQTEDAARLPCPWGDCNEYLQPQFLDPTSSSSVEDILLSSLASHLFQDHLGLQQFKDEFSNGHLELDRILAEMETTQRQAQGRVGQDPQYSSPGFDVPNVNATEDSVIPVHNQQTDTTDLQAPFSQDAHTHITPSPRTTNSTISSPTTSVAEVAPTGEGHVCRWEGCGLSFETCNDLTTHMSAAHVGSGKPQYDCLWEGCTRNGDKGFSSKQKICRHLQSHTGYRPFQCPECLQNFSEAATLQQHIRRHTQEKPYKCDFPGCGKSFAITGALTIHKRIHNGQKPFKCSYCGRGFAESSNLSKHLRTHTGERPYVCAEPGCGKAFARPDQLTRHTAVHKKKASSATAAEV